MFLISKIVRGRRLLQELEADAIRREAEEAAAAAAAAAKMAARLPRRGTQQGRGSKMFASGAPGTSSSSQALAGHPLHTHGIV
ncbi:unnamed protein product [Toxocara canis]|uniref:Uncharacterized protein n=1 Tax=Toxocara canis TaxID=6265 RepID=A0A183V704_TOXCA|nr:unnamed protein product [Toxocara canis]